MTKPVINLETVASGSRYPWDDTSEPSHYYKDYGSVSEEGRGREEHVGGFLNFSVAPRCTR